MRAMFMAKNWLDFMKLPMTIFCEIFFKNEKCQNACEHDDSKTAHVISMIFLGMTAMAMVKNWLDFRRLPMTTFLWEVTDYYFVGVFFWSVSIEVGEPTHSMLVQTKKGVFSIQSRGQRSEVKVVK